MFNLMARLSLLALLAFLTGCESLALFLAPKHELSDIGDKSLSQLIVTQQQRNASGGIPIVLDKKLDELTVGCGLLEPAPPPPTKRALPLVGVAVATVASGAVSLGASELQKFTEKQISKYGKSYRARASLDKQLPACIWFNRLVIETAKDGSEAFLPAFDFLARVIPSTNPTGFKLVPVYVGIARSAARTGSEGKLDLKINLKITALVETEGKLAKTSVLIEDSIPLSVTLPKAITTEKPRQVYTFDGVKDQRLNALETAWAPYASSMPLTIDMEVVESGLGKENLERVKSFLSDNSKDFVGAVKDAVKNALSE